MENVVSVVGAAIVVAIMGAFMMFECPSLLGVPKPEELYVVNIPKVSRI